ncbi:MAG: 4Fe-4S binding protein [Synergistaceae bacterium]|jgi:Fe-S-cluster-containing hydrogenase component 2|nr:4Fe-4S binding protein [Synergistaceae bacterium]
MSKAFVSEDKCVGCSSCEGACPVEAIKVSNGKAMVDSGTCIECGSCVSTCPVGAISQ